MHVIKPLNTQPSLYLHLKYPNVYNMKLKGIFDNVNFKYFLPSLSLPRW